MTDLPTPSAPRAGLRLTKDRRWCLRAFERGGWTIGRGDWVGVKKWDAHKAALVKSGCLEPDEYGGDNYRITDLGRLALEATSHE